MYLSPSLFHILRPLLRKYIIPNQFFTVAPIAANMELISCSSRFQLTSILFYILPLISSSNSLNIITPSGRTLPYNDILDFFPKKHQANPLNVLYDLSSQTGTLHGPRGFHFDLSSLCIEQQITKHPEVQLSFDGVAQPATNLQTNSTVVRTGNGYKAIYNSNGGHRKLVALWGNQLNLRPLQHVLYPSIFVNIADNTPPDDYNLYGPPSQDIPEENSYSNSNYTNVGNELILSATGQLPPVVARQEVSDTCARGVRHIIEVSISFESSLCNLYGGDAMVVASIVQAMVDSANDMFTVYTCFEVRLTSIEGFCNNETDPYKFLDDYSADSSEYSDKSLHIIYGFRQFFGANRNGINRDIAYLITGFDSHGNAAGRAFQPGTCNQGYAYGWVQGVNVGIFAHELGHNLNAWHFSEGVMSIDYRKYLGYSSDTITNITVYIDGDARSDCIAKKEEEVGSCNLETCVNQCMEGKCVEPYKPNRPTQDSIVPCTLVKSNLYCSYVTWNEDTGQNVFIYTHCPAQYRFLLRDFEEEDPTITCCRKTEDVVQSYYAQRGLVSFPVVLVNGTSYYTVDPPQQNRLGNLLNTDIVPSCHVEVVQNSPSPSLTPTASPSSTHSHSPSPSESISAVASPSSVTSPTTLESTSTSPSTSPSTSFVVSPSISFQVSPTPSASSSTNKQYPNSSPSASASPKPVSVQPKEGTCASAFTKQSSPSCGKALNMTLEIGRQPRVHAEVYIHRGFLNVTLRALEQFEILSYAVLFSTKANAASITRRRVLENQNKLRRKTVDFEYGTPLGNLTWTSFGEFNCCGRNAIKMFLHITVCPSGKSAQSLKCKSKFFSRSKFDTRCSDVCERCGSSSDCENEEQFTCALCSKHFQ